MNSQIVFGIWYCSRGRLKSGGKKVRVRTPLKGLATQSAREFGRARQSILRCCRYNGTRGD